jgi:cleavage stimulation factor subunit 3
MAETSDAELAFLESMPSGAELANDQPQATAEESDDEYDPSSLMPDNTSAGDAPDGSLDQGDPGLNAPSRSESRLSNPKPVPTAITTKPRTVGGFAVDSSDEEQSPVTQGANGHLDVAQTASKPAESLADPPKSSTPLADVPINSAAQDQGATGVASPDSASLTVPKPAPAAASDTGVLTPLANPTPPIQTPSQNAPAALTPALAAASVLPKARLPSDVIGMLEDRIAEDPRGDLEAWQDLISEHRKRNKLDEARKTYERFFEYFPRAVSSQHRSEAVAQLTIYRLTNGYHMRRWRLMRMQ